MYIAHNRRLVLRVLGALAALAWLAYAAHAVLGLGARGGDPLFDVWLYDGIVTFAALACVARAVLEPRGRAAWAVMGAGLLSWTCGEIYWSAKLNGLASPPFPSPADALYLGFYPACYVALVLLVRERVRGFSASRWLDGAIAALAVAAGAAALAFQPIVDATTGSAATVATNLAYPLGDLILLGLMVGVLGLFGWHPSRAWVLLGVGLILMAFADGIFLVQSADGTYLEGGALDALWPAAALLVAFAAWQPAEQEKRVDVAGRWVMLIPAASGFVALGLVRTDGAAGTLAFATLLLVTARMALAFLENQRVLEASQTEAVTDALTGMGNRRQLMNDLARVVEEADPEDPRLLAIFDLNGFKRYNDTFGHPAGDHLLTRVGQRLEKTVAPYGRAYRLGGDEFCALVRYNGTGPEPHLAAAKAALTQTGEGFEVNASFGAVELPIEASTVEQALQMADRRMYAQKGQGRSSASRQTRDVLLTALHERQPHLHDHLRDVADLSVAVGRRLGMSAEELDETARAAELHDVGKVAIPDAILNKPGPLDGEEWEFMRRHTIIGERILGSAPALAPVGKLVRSSHERFDGRGYPDGLVGNQIPLGARVVAVCDAYDAMTSDRPYREPLTPAEAMSELRRGAGFQFDPRVVDAFCEAHAQADEGTVPPADRDVKRRAA
jgi:two-component system cell cycle response regulator